MKNPLKTQHTPCGCSLLTQCLFDNNNHIFFIGQCVDLRNHETEITYCGEKEMIPVTKKQENMYKRKWCHICKEQFKENEKQSKVWDQCDFTGRFGGEISVVFHNGSNYDYHFIIKEVAEECKEEFECLGEYTEKYVTFSTTIRKCNIMCNDVLTSYKIKFIDRA